MRVARRLWAVGVLMLLVGVGMLAGGVGWMIAAAHEHAATLAELEAHDDRMTKGILLTAGGVFTCAAGAQVCRAASRRGGLSRLGRILLVGGYLLVATGLAVCAVFDSVGGFYAGFGVQAVGAVAVGIGGSAARRPAPGPRPSSHGPSGH